MAQTVARHRGREPDSQAGERLRSAVDVDELLELLSDEYARAIMREITSERLPARTIARRLDISRTTVYRRLDSLEAAGVVRTSMSFERDGHHRQLFTLALDGVELAFDADGITVEDVR